MIDECNWWLITVVGDDDGDADADDGDHDDDDGDDDDVVSTG